MLRPMWRDVLTNALKKPEDGYGMPVSNESRARVSCMRCWIANDAQLANNRRVRRADASFCKWARRQLGRQCS